MPREKLYASRGEETIALSVRMPGSVKRIIQIRAKKNRRSLNQEIVWLLERALELVAQEQDQAKRQSSR
ncbi:MAG: Arc family DNA-binding protein [Chloroflexi bacterium]|nr:Arc family DNA-binding protein [Chloroflexota bacterium]